jgi:hypothetical protein
METKLDLTTEPQHDAKLLLGGVDFKQKCEVKVIAGESCPEVGTKEINGDYVCKGCYENFKHLVKQ